MTGKLSTKISNPLVLRVLNILKSKDLPVHDIHTEILKDGGKFASPEAIGRRLRDLRRMDIVSTLDTGTRYQVYHLTGFGRFKFAEHISKIG